MLSEEAQVGFSHKQQMEIKGQVVFLQVWMQQQNMPAFLARRLEVFIDSFQPCCHQHCSPKRLYVTTLTMHPRWPPAEQKGSWSPATALFRDIVALLLKSVLVYFGREL